ncbi:MAG: uroporphyrinogen-III synthase [Acidimicrobiales bacterium]
MTLAGGPLAGGPLAGWHVGITADRNSSQQAELLARRGAEVFFGATLATTYLTEDDSLRAITENLGRHPPDYLVANTGVGMTAWFEAARTWGLLDGLGDALADATIVARGAKAAAAVRHLGFTVAQRPGGETLGEVLAILSAMPIQNKRVALQLHGDEHIDIAGRLSALGAEVVEIPVYRWRRPSDLEPARRLIAMACSGQLQAVTFTSAPALAGLFDIGGLIGRDKDLTDSFNATVVPVCIGPLCAEQARRLGIANPLYPEVGRLGLMIRVLCDHASGREP